METELPLLHAGKVRRLYAWPRSADGNPRLLMVATDNISAFDYVLDSTIPDKGKILTQLSLWWFDQLGVDNHVVSTDVPECLDGRAMVTEELTMIPVECVARGYLTGSGWVEYQQAGTVCGIKLPEGLVDGSRLPEPIFTPAIKAEVGEHDENVDFETIARLHGELLAAALRDLTIFLYRKAEGIARDRGLILADTKFEFGARRDGSLVLADEVLTPDSSRFWDASLWAPGGAQPSFDKQIVRDYLAYDSGWDKSSNTPPPALPAEVIAATQARYLEAYERLVGSPFPGYPSMLVPVASAPVAVESVAVPRPPMPTPPPVQAAKPVVAVPVAVESVAVPRPPMPTPPPVQAAKPVVSVPVAGAPVVAAPRPPMPTPPPVQTAKAVEETPQAATSIKTEVNPVPTERAPMNRVIVDVMPKPEILDPQGKAITGALKRLGFSGLSVRQGKRFEIEVDGPVTEETLAVVRDAAEKLLANTVIETYVVREAK